MRNQMLQFAKEKNIPLSETAGASKEDLLSADEIFLTNAVNGVRWVVALEEKRYYNRLPKEIVKWLNKQAGTSIG